MPNSAKIAVLKELALILEHRLNDVTDSHDGTTNLYRLAIKELLAEFRMRSESPGEGELPPETAEQLNSPAERAAEYIRKAREFLSRHDG